MNKTKRIYNINRYEIDRNITLANNLYLFMGGHGLIKCNVLFTKRGNPAEQLQVGFTIPNTKQQTVGVLYLTQDGTYKGAYKDGNKLARSLMLWEDMKKCK